jgi:hypothetical protein
VCGNLRGLMVVCMVAIEGSPPMAPTDDRITRLRWCSQPKYVHPPVMAHGGDPYVITMYTCLCVCLSVCLCVCLSVRLGNAGVGLM